MNDHEQIRKLLPLVSAGAADLAEESKVQTHLVTCSLCATELEAWKELAIDLRVLPIPQPSADLVKRARLLAAIELAREAERRSNKRTAAFLVVFTWAVTCWPVILWLTGGTKLWLGEHSRFILIGLVGYTVLAGFTAAIAAAILSLHQRPLLGGLHEPLSR